MYHPTRGGVRGGRDRKFHYNSFWILLLITRSYIKFSTVRVPMYYPTFSFFSAILMIFFVGSSV